MAKERATAEEVTALWDLAVRCDPTVHEIAAHLGVRPRRAQVAIHDLRLLFGDDEAVNLVAIPQGRGQPWRYRLVGTFDEAKGWTFNRTGDLETRLETIEAVVASTVRNLDGRSVDARVGRMVLRSIRRAREDLADLNGAA